MPELRAPAAKDNAALATGQPCADYCIFCYRDGVFTKQALSRDEIIDVDH